MAQLEIEYEDGSRQVVASDTSWKVTGDGPIRQADLLMGEFYDARREMPGWSTPGFDDSGWQPAILAAENAPQSATFFEFRNPTGQGGPRIEGRAIELGFQRPKLEAFPGVPVRVIEEIRPLKVAKRGANTYIFNLGQNFAGTVRLKVKGPAGHQLTLRFGEMLHPDGRLMTENLRKARATDFYVCRGDELGEVYAPRFTFHGFQYVEVTNFPGEPDLDTITGLVLHSDTPLTSTFECSDPMVDKLFRNVVWTQRANFLDLPTDCPQRDERMGWTGDAQVYVGTATYNADVAAFYTKWIRELMESQRPSGAFPGYAPFPFQHGWDFGTAWADAGIICPWTIWQAYGDTRMIERCWEPMTRFMQWRKQTSRDSLGIVHGNDWGDWLAQGAKTPLDYVDTVYFAISSRMMADMAEAIGRVEEAAAYRDQFQKIQAAFRKQYLNDDGGVRVNTQTALRFGVICRSGTGGHASRHRPETGRNDRVERQSHGHRISRDATVAARTVLRRPARPGTFLLQSHEFPSWGYEIDQGATSIWERWDSYTKEDGFGRHNAAMNSFAHYSFGAVCEWMFRTLAGIRSDGPGYAKILICPTPPAPGSNAQHPPINWVKASYDSIHGTIVSQWKVEGNRFELNVTIPTNTTGTVIVPASSAEDITESDQPLSGVEGVQVLRTERGRVVLHVESGQYHFASTGGVVPATVALTTSKPADQSLNPENIDLTLARQLFSWDFRNDLDLAKWPTRHNLQIQRRGDKVFLVATGNDPQLVTELSQPVSGPLAIELRGRPAQGASAQFFWASPTGGFNSGQQNSRSLNPADQLHSYLFRVGDDKPIQQLRFDPFTNQGEMEIESITIYQINQ